MLLALFKRTVLTALGVALGTGIAGAQIVLTVDTSNRTLTWSGTATSDEFMVEEGFPDIRLGLGNWTGGTSQVIPEGTLAVSSSSSFELHVYDSFHTTIAPAQDSLYVLLAKHQPVEYRKDPHTVTVTGDGTPSSFLQTDDTRWAFLGSLDGESLYFQRSFGGVEAIGDAAGSIAVIPEPSTMALLLGGLSALLILKRRRA